MFRYDPVAVVIDRLAERQLQVISKGSYFAIQCPSHPDREPSATLKRGDKGHALLKCFSGCTCQDMASSLGLTMRELNAGYRHTERRRGW